MNLIEPIKHLSTSSKSILVISPAPVFPTSAGNRRRILTVCESFLARGYKIDFAYYGHEDEIYRMFDAHPPTDMRRMLEKFRNVFYIEPDRRIKVKTRAKNFYLDDWYSDQLDYFVSWYFRAHGDCAAAIVNYVFLSAAFNGMPRNIVKIIDTHDRFYDRQAMYAQYRGEPNFFYLGKDEEAEGLSRADCVLAIQDTEQEYFSSVVDRPVYLFPHKVKRLRPSARPPKIRTVGFIGHGNDPNVASISPFVHLWAARAGRSRWPVLRVAGEVCSAFRGLELPNVQFLGYCDSLDDFYAQADIVVAPLIMGTGLKIKTIEALAYGKPVVGTRIAFEGLHPKHSAHRCESLEEVADAISKCVDDQAALGELSAACEEVFARYFERSQAMEDAFFQDFDARCAAAATTSGSGGRARVSSSTKISIARLGGGAAVWREVGPESSVLETSTTVRGPDGQEAILTGRLLATEKRIASSQSDEAELERAFSPFRARWFLGAEGSESQDRTPSASIVEHVEGLDDLPAPDAIVFRQDIANLFETAPLAEADRDRLIAKLLSARADWRAAAESVILAPFSLKLSTMAPTRFPLDKSSVWGVLTTRVPNDAGEDEVRHFRLDVTKRWYIEEAWTSGRRAAIREGSGLTITSIGLSLRSFRPIVGGLSELRLLYRGHIGVISLADV